ncbi:MAG: M1 family metallopeptidase [Bacteroidota bacterium]
MRFILSMLASLVCLTLFAQTAERWQQRAEYQMQIDFDVNTHRFTGKQNLVYYNNSPDELHKVFYHLYFNAFQPNSMMDIRSRTIADPDPRVATRIKSLKDNEIGYHKITSLKMDGQPVKYEVVGTILEVTLDKPIAPNSKVVFDMEFNSQVPLQIRRSGRMSAEGIDYSMSQWYPKMSEYDYQGWHANPYVGREFHGVWGDFDVKISIDKDYIIGATGHLQNPNEIGYGYEAEGATVSRPAGEKLTWHFVGKNIHDFVWAADPDYTHTKLTTDEGVTMHFLYQENERTKDNWEALPKIMSTAQSYMNKHFGAYPYDIYSFIQGGDGGMEYPMATLITGERNLSSLVGVSVHEWFHSWYQMVLGSNESLYAWMDEGFTSYGSTRTMDFLKAKKLIPGEPSANPFAGTYRGFAGFAMSGREEPLSTHADHFMTNSAYGVGSYTKGSIFLHQLEYIIGKEVFDKALIEYYDTWKFKHPNVNDFIRVMEKASGLELDWYKEYWVNTTHTIDYGVQNVEAEGKKQTKITLQKLGVMPMPLDVAVITKDGKTTTYNIPLRIMRGEKKATGDGEWKVAEDWPWTHPTYELMLDVRYKDVEKVQIDPSGRMMDVNPSNDTYEPSS